MMEMPAEKYESIGHLIDDMICIHMADNTSVYAEWRGRLLCIAELGDGSRKSLLTGCSSPDVLVSYLESMKKRYGIHAEGKSVIERRIQILDSANKWRRNRVSMTTQEEVDILSDIGVSLSLYADALRSSDPAEGQTRLVPDGSPRAPLLNPADALMVRVTAHCPFCEKDVSADIDIENMKISKSCSHIEGMNLYNETSYSMDEIRDDIRKGPHHLSVDIGGEGCYGAALLFQGQVRGTKEYRPAERQTPETAKKHAEEYLRKMEEPEPENLSMFNREAVEACFVHPSGEPVLVPGMGVVDTHTTIQDALDSVQRKKHLKSCAEFYRGYEIVIEKYDFGGEMHTIQPRKREMLPDTVFLDEDNGVAYIQDSLLRLVLFVNQNPKLEYMMDIEGVIT